MRLTGKFRLFWDVNGIIFEGESDLNTVTESLYSGYESTSIEAHESKILSLGFEIPVKDETLLLDVVVAKPPKKRK
ncbi:MAG TPA: hypothetical protein EYN64_04535 [Flavobacteriales bacterium]|nr:hypothetical protein [Flavobacteriales bacterium]